MAKKLTVRLGDEATDTYVEVDGERICGVSSVQASYDALGGTGGVVTLTLVDADFVDERQSGTARSA